MPSPDPTAVAAAVLAALGDAPGRPRRFIGLAGGRLVVVQVRDAGCPPVADVGPTEAAKRALVAAVAAAGKPVSLKVLVREMARQGHRKGTVTKALAELGKDGELVNRRDNKGYRLPEWSPPTPPAAPPGLFDGVG